MTTPQQLRLVYENGEPFIPDGHSKPVVIADPQAVWTFMKPIIEQERFENFWLLPLGVNRVLLSPPIVIARGQRTAVITDVADIARAALLRDASEAVIVHNHPGIDTTPSSADISSTEAVLLGLGMFGIILVDHIVVTPQRFASIRSTNPELWYKDVRKRVEAAFETITTSKWRQEWETRNRGMRRGILDSLFDVIEGHDSGY